MTEKNSGVGTGIGIGVGILIGCGIALLVCLVVGGAAVFIVGNGVAKFAGTAVSSLTNGPFEIGKRPIPSEPAAELLLPATVGDFSRGEVTTNGTKFSTTYTNGSDTITAIANTFNSITAAQQAVKAAGTADSSLIIKMTGLEPSYVTNNLSPDQATKIFYNRGKFEFGFASTSASAYNAFMAKFPF